MKAYRGEICLHIDMCMYTHHNVSIRYMSRETRIFPQTCRVGYPRIAVRQVIDIREHCGMVIWHPRQEKRTYVRTYVDRYGSPKFLCGSSQLSWCSD